MTFSWQEFIDNLFCSGYKQKYERCSANYAQCQKRAADLNAELAKADEKIKQLELLVPMPPPPKLDYVVERDSLWVQQRLESLGLNIVRLPLDAVYRFTNKKNFMNILTWDITDQLEYVKNFFDCPDFAMHFMVTMNLIFRIQVAWVIDYKSAHSYNLVLFPDGNVFILEPQSDGMYLWTKRPEQFYHLKGAIVAI